MIKKVVKLLKQKDYKNLKKCISGLQILTKFGTVQKFIRANISKFPQNISDMFLSPQAPKSILHDKLQERD